MPGSSFFDGWDFTADPCGFPGVFCDGTRVSALALGDPRAGSPGLTGRLDPALGRLSALTELSLVPGRVQGGPPRHARVLHGPPLPRRQQEPHSPAASPTGSAPLSSLRTLDLSFNQISGAIPPSLASLPSLTNLILCHNQLSGGIPTFPDSSPLLRLDLKHNALSGAVPATLPSQLQYLSLQSNHLTGRVDAVLPRLTRLNFLDLSMNQLDGPIPSSVFALPLSVLQLQRNFFAGPVQPSSDVAIPVVDLSYNRFWGQVSPLLAGVGQLYLNNNRFTGDVPARLVQELVGSGGLQLLYLQHNFLTGIEISPSSSLPSGVSLCLMYNCMVPPVYAPCPIKAGSQNTRPADQCPEWRG
ncbi:hypothetical protein PR202_ga13644 [Eleusine coracana subsp. coracana]|uniref:Leucine-rich repeat-containing N-terminal plant-type domain-containing protein n=1 Tax=Eleusine coracana subsp. coracana TaxID=191504 RepID=A0AAV5CF87_ELECO|nr:hypothetical protein PR202_ga13644 [Eleusine coracana subsp. coracana]